LDTREEARKSATDTRVPTHELGDSIRRRRKRKKGGRIRSSEQKKTKQTTQTGKPKGKRNRETNELRNEG